MAQLEIPNRSLFRQPEVCEIASIQPYVLRSWEAEFPDLGVAKAEGGPRVYRRADVERVLRIKQLLYGEGLTLAGVRRKLVEERPPDASTGSGAGEHRRALRQRRARAHPAREARASRVVGDARPAARHTGGRGRRRFSAARRRTSAESEGEAQEPVATPSQRRSR